MLVLLVLTLLCGLGIGLARGGTLEALGRVHVFRPWLFAALVLALAVGRLVPSLHSASWIVAAVLAALFSAANNRLPGLGLLVAGILANAAVILVNKGQMPVSLWGAERAGVPISDILASDFHSPAGDGTSLRVLSDIIPLPFPAVPAVLSIGDVAIASALGLFGAVTPVRARRTLQARRHGGMTGAMVPPAQDDEGEPGRHGSRRPGSHRRGTDDRFDDDRIDDDRIDEDPLDDDRLDDDQIDGDQIDEGPFDESGADGGDPGRVDGGWSLGATARHPRAGDPDRPPQVDQARAGGPPS